MNTLPSHAATYPVPSLTGVSPEELRNGLQNGWTFRVFRYQIGLVGVTLSKTSELTLIKNEEELKNAIHKYNSRTLAFGWWSISGPFRVFDVLKWNNAGGVDMTHDVALNLEHYDPLNATIEFRTMWTVFDHLPKDDLKEARKALQQYCSSREDIHEAYVAEYINSIEEGPLHTTRAQPYFIGLDCESPLETHLEAIKELVYKRFQSFVDFQVFVRSDDEELFKRIRAQGDTIMP